MGVLDGKKVQSAAIPQQTDFSAETGSVDIANATTPRFLPSNLLDVGLCKSAEDLEQVKAALADFRKVAALTKQKFAAQRNAADIALELAKSQNQLVAYFAQTALKQAKTDAELMALLQAVPGMLSAISGTVEVKKTEKVRSFTERLKAAGEGRRTEKKTTR